MKKEHTHRSLSEEKALQGDYAGAVAEFMSERKGGVTFVELRDFLAPHMEVEGKIALPLPKYENIILWVGTSQTFFDAVAKALSAHLIESHPTQVLVYMVDGCMVDMPLAKSLRQYKEPHWLPIAFNPYVDETPVKKGQGK
jgi:hypothetical protein